MGIKICLLSYPSGAPFFPKNDKRTKGTKTVIEQLGSQRESVPLFAQQYYEETTPPGTRNWYTTKGIEYCLDGT